MITSFKTFNVSDKVLHSSGEHGSDISWETIGKQFGLQSCKHYYYKHQTPYGNTSISDIDYNEGVSKILEASTILNEQNIDRRMHLLSRNWMQVKNSNTIYAIVEDLEKGETWWTVIMALQENKPVYVFSQKTNKWYYLHDLDKNGKYTKEESNVPSLTNNFAGTGTKNINHLGKQAIKNVYLITTGKVIPENLFEL